MKWAIWIEMAQRKLSCFWDMEGPLLLVICKGQASLRMFQFPRPLESDLTFSGFWTYSCCFCAKPHNIIWKEESLAWLKERISRKNNFPA